MVFQANFNVGWGSSTVQLCTPIENQLIKSYERKQDGRNLERCLYDHDHEGVCYEGLIPYGMGMRLLDDFVNGLDIYTYIQSY